MFFDEDGDLAHEFFIECEARCEVTYSRVRWSMKKIQNGLKPQVHVYNIYNACTCICTCITWLEGSHNLR